MVIFCLVLILTNTLASNVRTNLQPWTPDRFAQIDHLMCPQRWKNSIKDVESRTDIAVDSDHAMIIARIKIKLKSAKTMRRRTINRYREPTEALKTQFNDRIRETHSFTSGSKGIEVNNARFTHAISKAAKERLTKIPFEQKKCYTLCKDRGKQNWTKRSGDSKG